MDEAWLNANWVRKPDCKGGMGWEIDGLEDWQRWWAFCEWEDLPKSLPEIKLAAEPAKAATLAKARPKSVKLPPAAPRVRRKPPLPTMF